jgi:hypothetical protein
MQGNSNDTNDSNDTNESSNCLYIQIKVKYNLNNYIDFEKVSNKLDETLTNFDYDKEVDTIEHRDSCGCMPNPEFMLIILHIQKHDNKDYFENLLDELRKEIKLRYIIKSYEPNKKYPSSIRINKSGNKIITKQQTKLLGL